MTSREASYCSSSNDCDTCECAHHPMRNGHVYCSGRGEFHAPVRGCGCYQQIKGLVPVTKSVEPAQPQKRDESRDIVLYRGLVRSDASLGGGPFTVYKYGEVSNDDWERYVPHSQLVAASRDSELLDAIIDAYSNAIDRAIAERSKR